MTLRRNGARTHGPRNYFFSLVFSSVNGYASNMKRDFRRQVSAIRLIALSLGWALAVAPVAANPYAAIAGRNVFALKPPTPDGPPPPPPAAAVTIKLRGISTILDRRQVLLKVMTAARPPALAHDDSYLMSEGQREGELEVLEIDAMAGTVKLKNQGETLLLTMKEDSEKPPVGAALPAATPHPPLPGVQPPPGAIPGVNPAALPPVPGMVPRTIPTRSIRGAATDGAAVGTSALGTGLTAGQGSGLGTTASSGSDLSTQPSASSQRSVEENVALYELNRAKNDALIQAGAKLPRMPPHILIKRPQPQPQSAE